MLLQGNRRRVRIRLQPTGQGQWKAVALGMLRRVVSESQPGRHDEAERRARNYERYGTWEQS